MKAIAPGSQHRFYFAEAESFGGIFLPVLNNKGVLLPAGETLT